MALFSHDSKFMRFMDRMVDVALLNLLWLVTSLPLITLGPATVAAHAVLLKLVDDEEGPLVRAYFRAFRENFLRGLALGLLALVALAAVAVDLYLVLGSDDPSLVILIVSIVSVVFLFCCFLYAFPLVARYDTSVGRALINSVNLCVRYPIRTLVLLTVTGFEIALFTWNVPMMVVGILVGPMILLYTVAGMAKRLFQSADKGD